MKPRLKHLSDSLKLKPFFSHSSNKIGLAPGTLLYTGQQKQDKPRLHLLEYSPDHFDEKDIDNWTQHTPDKLSENVAWLNIDGLHEIPLIEHIGKEYGLHPLVLEDILSTHQVPKVDFYDDYIFVVLKMLTYDDQADAVRSEQVSLVLGKGFVLSFQEQTGDVFDPVRDRIHHTRWRIRRLGPDYLFYALIDSIVDHYFVVLEKIMEKIERLQEQVITSADENTLRTIHSLKREMLYLRKSVWPLREMINHLIREEYKLISKDTVLFFRDVYDHAVHVIDLLETCREMVSSLFDVYMSSVSNRMNVVMKVLTIIATIFIPLTFIAGIYGMNFDHMPELHYRYAYPIVWAIMLLVTLVMLAFFKWKKWL